MRVLARVCGHLRKCMCRSVRVHMVYARVSEFTHVCVHLRALAVREVHLRTGACVCARLRVCVRVCVCE